MANRKILLDPSKWVVDEDNRISLRYRVVTNDLNVRSAFSPVYRIAVPAKEDVFSSINNAITKTVVGSNTSINVSWTTSPVYDNFVYYVFLQKPNESGYTFIKSTQDSSFSYVVPSSETGSYSIAISIPTTTKTVLENALLFVATTTI